MAKTIFEELGGKYERQVDYLIPCIALPAEEEQPNRHMGTAAFGLFEAASQGYIHQSSHKRQT